MIKFLDLRVSETERKAFVDAFHRLCDHGQFVMGLELDQFEKKIAKYLGRSRAVGVSSGTDALYLALRAIDLRPGDEVITSSLSWIATANSIFRAGGTPVFSDVGEDLNMDPASVERLISKKTKAIVSVDFTGKLCDYAALSEMCSKKNIILIQDGSQAFGAKRHGFRSGAVGLISAISHNPMKVFGALGEAGSVLTDSDELADRIEILRYNGTINKEICIEPSLNGRMDALQAAFLSIRLDNYEGVLGRRFKNYLKYKSELANNKKIKLPIIEKDETHSLYTLTIRAERRDELIDYLQSFDIETKIQHPILMCDQQPYLNCRKESDLARTLIKEILSIPVQEKLTDNEVSEVSKKINSFYGY